MLKKFSIWICIALFIFLLVIAIFSFIVFMQNKMFLSQDYVMWVFKDPVSRLVFLFEIYILLAFAYIRQSVFRFARKHKKWVYPGFIVANVLLLYTVIFNVSVVTNHKIIDYTFFKPTGKVYNFSEIVSIDTGVYGNRSFNSFLNNYGQFYYVLTLKDGTKIDLNGDAGGTQNNRDFYEVFEELDTTFVGMGIKKTASMDSFELFEQDIDKIYSQRVKRILTNVN